MVIHHTVTSGSAKTVRICHDGYDSLPGPLCHGVITKDGTVHLVGHGRANHAGNGDGKDPWSDAQLDAIERASAAICRAHGWKDRKSVV